MADDHATASSQRRSRLAPPPTASSTPSSFRAQPAASRVGFGSSSSRNSTFAVSTAASRASTLSSSAFGRNATTRAQRPSSAESSTATSRLRQKPTATAAASAPKKSATASTSDLFAALASDAQPRASSAGSLPKQTVTTTVTTATKTTTTTTTFAASVASSAPSVPAAGQLFSMDDSDLGGDDGWGVDSPNILSPASGADETTGVTSATKTFEEDEFGWVDEVSPQVPFPAPTQEPVAPPSPATVEAPAATSSAGWGYEFEYSADATEALADESAWNDDDEWGTLAPGANGVTTFAEAPAVAAEEKPAANESAVEVPEPEPVATTAFELQAPPLTIAPAVSTDLGAILSPSGQAGEFWGDEGDDELFGDDEPNEPAVQALDESPPLPHVDSLSLQTPPVQAQQSEALAPSQIASEFSYNEFESSEMVTEDASAEAAWRDEDPWLEGSEVSQEKVEAHTVSTNADISEVIETSTDVHTMSSTEVVYTSEQEEFAKGQVSENAEYGSTAPLTKAITTPSMNDFEHSHDAGSSSIDAANYFSEQSEYSYSQQYEAPVAHNEQHGYEDHSGYSHGEHVESVGHPFQQHDNVEQSSHSFQELNVEQSKHSFPEHENADSCGYSFQQHVDQSDHPFQQNETMEQTSYSYQHQAEGEDQSSYSHPEQVESVHQSDFSSSHEDSVDQSGYSFQQQAENVHQSDPFSHHAEIVGESSYSFHQQVEGLHQSDYTYEQRGDNMEQSSYSYQQHNEGGDFGLQEHHESEVSAVVDKSLASHDDVQESHSDEHAGFASFDQVQQTVAHEEIANEPSQRQVTWETHQDYSESTVEKSSGVEEVQGSTPFAPPPVPVNKGEVSFGSSSFGAAELTYGHYYHEHHRTPSEAEVGSVASFAEASSAGATFGGSDNVSDGTYSDGDYASETRSVFGSSSAHSTAFITEPPSSSDGQGSVEDNGTFDQRSDISSTVGAGGGPQSDFEVSSTRSALFENEVASAGFEQVDDVYAYGEHPAHHHFAGNEYEEEFNHRVSHSSHGFENESSSVVADFGSTDAASITSSSLSRLTVQHEAASPVASRSSTPAAYGVSSSQDLPTASDLEFEHSDTEIFFASSSNELESPSFGVSSPFGASAPPTTPFEAPNYTTSDDAASPFSSQQVSLSASTPSESFAKSSFDANTPVEEDANPFASSGGSFGFPSAPSGDFANASVHSPVGNASDELPSAASLFGASPGNDSPFGTFGGSHSEPPQPPTVDETTIADAGGLFADAPAVPGFGGFDQSQAAPSDFFGGSIATPSQGFEREASFQHYGYENQSHQSADQVFGGSGQHHSEFNSGAYGYESETQQSADQVFGGSGQHHSEFDSGAYGYENEIQQSADQVFGGSGQHQSEFDSGGYGYEASSQQANAEGHGSDAHDFDGKYDYNQSAIDTFGASADGGYGTHGGDFGFYDSTPAATDSFFEGSSSTSAAEVFGSSGTDTHQGDWHGEQTHYDHSDVANDFRSSDEHRQSISSANNETGYSAPLATSDEIYAHEAPTVESFAKVTHEKSSIASQLEEVSQSYESHSSSVFATSDHSPTDIKQEHPAESIQWTSEKHDFSHVDSFAHEETHEVYKGYQDNEDLTAHQTNHDSGNFFGQSAEVSAADPFASGLNHSGASHGFGGHHAEHEQQLPDNSFPHATSAMTHELSKDFSSSVEKQSVVEPKAESELAPAEERGEAHVGGEFESSYDFGDQKPQERGDIHHEEIADANSSMFGSTDATYQSDSSAFFGSQDTTGPFGTAGGNDVSGFFSNGPAQHHLVGGIYAQPPQANASYGAYSHTQYQEDQGAFGSPPSEFAAADAHHDYNVHGHHESLAPAPTTPVAQDTSYGASPAGDALHFESAHSSTYAVTGTSHFDSSYVSSAYQSNYEGTRQDTSHTGHYDASYRTPDRRHNAGPPAQVVEPSSLQHHETKAPYNQFAKPLDRQTKPTYVNFAAAAQASASYETKSTYTTHAIGTVALASNKYKDPNMVVPSCLTSFGFGGNVVTMFPKQKLRLNSASFASRNSPRTHMSMQQDNAPQCELRKGPIGIYRMDQVHPKNSDFEELDKFPGPLNDSVGEGAILRYVEERMSSGGSSPANEDERLLLGVLRVLIKCNGRLRSDVNANPNDPSSPEVQLVSLLKESDQRRRRNQTSHFPPPKPVQYATHHDATARNASRVRELLLLGDRKAAVDVAIQAQMWPEAMLIGSFTDKDEYKRVLCAYFTTHYAPGDPCRALYLSFADQQERSVHEPQKLMQQGTNDDSSAILSTWVVHVQMLLANRTADTNKILVELGDRLWKEANAVVAAHICYLLAGNTVEAPSPSSKIALLGADHRTPEEARFYVSPATVQRTEIYEWVQKRLNPAATNMIPFQGYKLIYAMILADHGKLETAFKYVNSMLTVIRAITATMKPGTSMYLEGMQNQLIVLDDRLRQHLGQDRADSVAAAASAKQGKWGLGSALSIMGKIVNRVVEGNDAPQQAGPPRSSNGSLFQGAPRSNNNAVPLQPEYPSGAAIGYSSTSASGPVHAGPGSTGSRGGASYGAQPQSFNNGPTSAAPYQPPSVPAAFNVPRPQAGRNSAPPHQPTQDFSAPLSGSGNTAQAPLSSGGGDPFAAAPPQPHQYASSQFDSAPPAQAPPPFQKPTLDLSSGAGKSGFGHEAPAPPVGESKPKSPRSPRAVGGGPGSDKGSKSPKVKDTKKGGRSKTPPPSRSSSGWLSGLSTFIASKMNPDAKVAKLGDHMDAYFDEEKKRWVFPGETQTDEPTMPSAPPTGPLPGSTPASTSGGPPGGPPGTHSAPGSMAGGASDDPLAALMAPPPARTHATLMKKDPLSAMMAPPQNRAMYGQRSNTMPAKRPPRPQFAVFKPAPGSTTSSAPSDQEPPPSNEPPAPQ